VGSQEIIWPHFTEHGGAQLSCLQDYRIVSQVEVTEEVERHAMW
jgi:hypothetical protein